jgi:hypothetical protein
MQKVQFRVNHKRPAPKRAISSTYAQWSITLHRQKCNAMSASIRFRFPCSEIRIQALLAQVGKHFHEHDVYVGRVWNGRKAAAFLSSPCVSRCCAPRFVFTGDVCAQSAWTRSASRARQARPLPHTPEMTLLWPVLCLVALATLASGAAVTFGECLCVCWLARPVC